VISHRGAWNSSNFVFVTAFQEDGMRVQMKRKTPKIAKGPRLGLSLGTANLVQFTG